MTVPAGVPAVVASPSDPLSDVLRKLEVDSSAIYIFDLHEPWEYDLSDLPVAISWTVLDGTVWIHGPGGERQELHGGDSFILPRGGTDRQYVVTSHGIRSAAPATGAAEVFRKLNLQEFDPKVRWKGAMRGRLGGEGARTRVVSAAWQLNDRKFGPLVAALPSLIVERGDATDIPVAGMHLQILDDAESVLRPGFRAVVTQMVQIMLVRMIRTYALSTGTTLGWLAGLGDPQIARALASIHRDPSAPWKVATLAKAAGLSRSEFAKRFHSLVGQTTMQYLRAWRMHLACEALSSQSVAIATLAMDLGYHSEAAFRSVFRKGTGLSPTQYRRIRGGGPSAGH